MLRSMQWRVIRPLLLEELPVVPGVFELGSLVRNVVYIGWAPSSLSSSIREALEAPALGSRCHCLRFETTPDAERRANALLAAYRRTHGGLLPPAQREPISKGPEKPRVGLRAGVSSCGAPPSTAEPTLACFLRPLDPRRSPLRPAGAGP